MLACLTARSAMISGCFACFLTVMKAVAGIHSRENSFSLLLFFSLFLAKTNQPTNQPFAISFLCPSHAKKKKKSVPFHDFLKLYHQSGLERNYASSYHSDYFSSERWFIYTTLIHTGCPIASSKPFIALSGILERCTLGCFWCTNCMFSSGTLFGFIRLLSSVG